MTSTGSGNLPSTSTHLCVSTMQTNFFETAAMIFSRVSAPQLARLLRTRDRAVDAMPDLRQCIDEILHRGAGPDADDAVFFDELNCGFAGRALLCFDVQGVPLMIQNVIRVRGSRAIACRRPAAPTAGCRAGSARNPLNPGAS